MRGFYSKLVNYKIQFGLKIAFEIYNLPTFQYLKMRNQSLFFTFFISFTFSILFVNGLNDIDKNRLERKVHLWSDAHNTPNKKKFNDLYGNSVFFYCEQHTKEETVELKFNSLKKYTLYIQNIVSEIRIKKINDDYYKCEFVKEVKFNNCTKKYNSYLIFNEIGSNYKIICESDEITDRNLNCSFNKNRLHFSSEKEENIPIEPIKDNEESNYKLTFVLVIILILLGFIINYLLKKGQKKGTIIVSETKSNSTENYLKGLAFEKYIVNKFSKDYFSLIEWQGDKATDEFKPISNKNPDTVWEYKNGTRQRKFAVECKFRSKFVNDKVDICNIEKLNHYKEFGVQRNMEVFIILGVGGAPEEPKDLYIIRIDNFPFITNKKNLNPFLRKGKASFFYDYQKNILK